MKNLIPFLLLAAAPAFAAEIHVAVADGDDAASGSGAHPLKTISAAARKAMPGDTITVHAGVYRERVDPPRGGTDDAHRIVYQAAPGEKVVITGSEAPKGWTKVEHGTWKLVLPKTFFKDFNPFTTPVGGEWCDRGLRSSGTVYLSGEWMAAAASKKAVLAPAGASPRWFSETDAAGATTVYAQFKDIDPNAGAVEIAARQSVFYPSKPGIGFITVRGFELRNAATPWAGAMSEQIGLIGTHWSKGWIIEDNEIHHSLCTGVTLGRYGLPAKEFPAATTPGFITSIKLALRDGWSKAKVGSHIVRRNNIHHCEKNGIHGSLGAVFSEISGNDIHDIARTGWISGADLAGIKFLGGVDMIIRDNHIHGCGGTGGGIWLDWMCQGTLVSGNLLHDNAHQDIFTEVNHGPFLLADNLFFSSTGYYSCSQGGAYAHNLFAGNVRVEADAACGGRLTPYLKPHSTDIVSYTAPNPLGDLHWMNNLFAAGGGIACLDAATWPVTAQGNVYAPGARAPKQEKTPLIATVSSGAKLVKKEDGWYLSLKTDADWKDAVKRRLVTTALLGKAKIPQQEYTLPDGSSIVVDTDYFGKKRDISNPFPGPFETPVNGEVKVWPK